MQAVILAGGLGTRLGSVSGALPKPMVPIQGKPFLAYQLKLLQAFGIREIVLCVGYRAEAIRAYFADGNGFGLDIHYAAEPEFYGTAGALKWAQPLLAETFLVLNGDTYAVLDYGALLHFHSARSAQLTLAVTRSDNQIASGTVQVENERVLAFAEKVAARATEPSPWINAGVYVMHREILDSIPPMLRVSLELETFPELLAHHARVFAFPFQDYLLDIGTPETYQQFQADVVKRDWNAVSK